MSEIPPGQDLVFIARAPIAGAAFREVEAVVEGLLSQAGFIK
jgi:RNase P protein component